MADRNLEADKHQGFGWFDLEASASWAASKGASIKTILEAGDWAHASTTYRHYIKCLPEAVAQRIAEQISGSVQANVVGQLDVDIDPEPD